MSKILITGGAGFLGYFLAKSLSEDKSNRLTIVDNFSRGLMDKEMSRLLEKVNVTLVNGDLTDINHVRSLDKDYEYIFHLAAVIGVKNVMKEPDKVLRINAISTLNLFEYAKELKHIKRVLFSSTSEVYSGTHKHFGIKIPTDESVFLAIDDVSAPRTTYALSKIYGESAAFVYGEKYDIPFTIIRYHNIYGPRMGFDHVIPETFVKIKKDSSVEVSSPGHTRAFCYVDDAVEFTIRAALRENGQGQVLHIGNPQEEIKIKELVIKIAEIMGKVVSIKELPDTAGSPSRRCPDISKAVMITGYNPQVSLEDGISKAYEWYRDKI